MSINFNFNSGAIMWWVSSPSPKKISEKLSKWHVRVTCVLLFSVCCIVVPCAAYGAESVQLSVSWSYADNVAGLGGFRLYSTNNLICETRDPAARKMTCAVVVQGQTMPFAMTAIDATGKESAASAPFWVDFGPVIAPVDQPPSAYITASPVYGVAPLQVRFDGSQSLDPDGTIIAYSWDFSDGEQAAVVMPTHTFAVPGVYAVALVVTDDKGNTARAESMVTVIGTTPGQGSPGNLPPGAVISVQPPTPGSDTLRVSFDGSESTDSDGIVAVYRWDFGDGESGTGAMVSHAYGAPGTYSVTLVVADNGGLTGLARKEITLSSLPVQPTAVPRDSGVAEVGGAAVSGSGGGGCSVRRDAAGGGGDWLLLLIFLTALPLVARPGKLIGNSWQ